jgi:hypothetical protein
MFNKATHYDLEIIRANWVRLSSEQHMFRERAQKSEPSSLQLETMTSLSEHQHQQTFPQIQNLPDKKMAHQLHQR